MTIVYDGPRKIKERKGKEKERKIRKKGEGKREKNKGERGEEKEKTPSLHFITRSETSKGLQVPEILKIYIYDDAYEIVLSIATRAFTLSP